MQTEPRSEAEQSGDDDREFTDEQLRAALKDVGRQVRENAFRAGLPIHFIKDGAIVALYPDGTEKIVKVLAPAAHQPLKAE